MRGTVFSLFDSINELRHSISITFFLHGYIRQMSEQTTDVARWGVFNAAKTTEAVLELISSQRTERRDQNVETYVELLTAYQKRVVDVSVQSA